MGWLQISAQTLGKPSWWALHGRQLGPRCACRPSHWPWPPALAQGCSWLPSMCLAWAITPRAPSADRLCASERREQKTRRHSLKPLGQCGCSTVKSGHPVAWLPSHCPRFMPCTRCAETYRPLVRAQTMSGISQTAGVIRFESGDRCRGDVFPFGGSGCRRTSVRPPAAADP